MTKDEALKLALEAGYKDLPTVRLAYQGFDIQHFTNLVIAAERHRVLAEERAALTQSEQEAIYGMNPDDWKDLTEAVKKVRDGRGIYLACRPADVFQEWFLALGTAKIKERT